MEERWLERRLVPSKLIQSKHLDKFAEDGKIG